MCAGKGLYSFIDGSRVQGEWSDGWPLETEQLEEGVPSDTQYTENLPSPLDKPSKPAKPAKPAKASGDTAVKKPVKKVGFESSSQNTS